MSERAPRHEHQEAHETTHEQHEAAHHHAEKHHAHHERAAKKPLQEVSKLREEVERQAVETSTQTIEQPRDDEPDTMLGMQQSLKDNAYNRTLADIQRRLPKPAKLFSEFTHSRYIDAASNVSAKTIARPSGILGGSICAFLGTLIVLYSAKHYGFRYNYALFILLFVGGYVLGATLELLIWLFYSRRRVD